jgi:hypothetical protein
MAVTISQFTISTTDIFGFSTPALAGFNDVIGTSSINQSEKYLVAFGGNGVRALYWFANQSVIYFEVYGLHENSGWDYITINGVNYNRSSGTFSRFTVSDNSSFNYPTGGGEEGGPYTRWTWAASSFPFASYAAGSTQAMYVRHSGSKPASGALSLNTIHTIAGGSSGTSVGLNDSDVRALNWYNTVVGSPIASGGKNAIQEYYYPCNVGENQGYTRRRLPSTTSNSLSYKLASADADIDNASINAAVSLAKCGMTVEFDGTNTRLRYHLLSTGNFTGSGATITLTNQYWNAEASGTGSPQTYSAVTNDAITFEGVQVIQAALLTSQHNQSLATGTQNPGGGQIGQSSYNVSGFGETLMSTNSITSFVTTAANTAYGRSFQVSTTMPRFTYGDKVSTVDIRFRWALRLLGYSPADRTFIEKDTTLNFMISLRARTDKFN